MPEFNSNETQEMIGIVENGLFKPLGTEVSDGFKLSTSVSIVAGENIDNIDMNQYEGKALLIKGLPPSQGYIFRTEVLDEGKPLLTAVIRKLFD